jgi:hypothetical protein
MAPQRIERTSHRDVTASMTPPRPGSVTHAEGAIDQESNLDAIEKVHGSGLHSWGLGAGLRVRATKAKPSLWVEAGVAIDVEGRHVSLAADGEAELSSPPDPLNPVGTPMTIQAPGTPVAIEVPTAGLAAGDRILTVQFWEALDSKVLSSGVWRLIHLPWIRLQDPAAFVDNGADGIPLALVRLVAGGDVQSLDAYTRRQAGLPAGTIWVRKGFAGGSPQEGPTGNEVRNVDVGIVRPRNVGAGPSGSGLEICVPNGQNEIHLQQTNGSSFRKLALAAEGTVARRQDGAETVTIDAAQAAVVAGTGGAGGAVVARDASSQDAVTLSGDGAAVVAGAGGNPGDMRTRDSNGLDSIVLDGQPGDVRYRGSLIDPNGAHNGVTHGELAQLTGGGSTTLHRHATGNVARPAAAIWLSSRFGAPDIRTFVFPAGTRLLATIGLTSVDPRGPLLTIYAAEAFLAEILRVSGADYRAPVGPTAGSPNFFFDPAGGNLGISGAASNLRAPFFAGAATSITFQVRSPSETRVWGLGLIFIEA